MRYRSHIISIILFASFISLSRCGPSPVKIAKTRVTNEILKIDNRIIEIFASGSGAEYSAIIKNAQEQVKLFNDRLKSCNDVPCFEELENEVTAIGKTLSDSSRIADIKARTTVDKTSDSISIETAKKAKKLFTGR